MSYNGKVEYAHARKMRDRNTVLYRVAHLPIWITVFFLAPGPLTFSMFVHGFGRGNLLWLAVVLAGTGVAGLRGRLPGVEPKPYILRFDEDRPNPLYRRVCYTFAWNALLSYALLNMSGLILAAATGVWYMKQLYHYAYWPVCGAILLLGAVGALPRVGLSTKGEGMERRYFYCSIWAVTLAQTLLLVLWRTLPQTRTASPLKLAVYAGTLCMVGLAAYRGALPRTRPIEQGMPPAGVPLRMPAE